MKPHKIEVTNELNNKTYGASFATLEEANAWKDSCISKNSFGKPQRYVTLLEGESLPAELESRVIGTEVIAATELEDEKTLKEVKADYVITQTNQNLSKTFRNASKKESRKSEYPSLEEVLHIILDHGLDSQEMINLQTLRQSIKDSYPLE